MTGKLVIFDCCAVLVETLEINGMVLRLVEYPTKGRDGACISDQIVIYYDGSVWIQCYENNEPFFFCKRYSIILQIWHRLTEYFHNRF